jgi:hypothetical protein
MHNQPAPAVKRAFGIIEVVANEDSCLNISEVHRAVHLPLGSIAAASPLSPLQLSGKERLDNGLGLDTIHCRKILQFAEKNHIASGVDSTEV